MADLNLRAVVQGWLDSDSEEDALSTRTVYDRLGVAIDAISAAGVINFAVSPTGLGVSGLSGTSAEFNTANSDDSFAYLGAANIFSAANLFHSSGSLETAAIAVQIDGVSSEPVLVVKNTAAAANTKVWDTLLGATTLSYRAVSDGYAAASNYMVVTRSAGTVTGVSFPTGDLTVSGGDVEIQSMGSDTGTNLLINASDVIQKDSSSERYKDNISAVTHHPLAITKLTPVLFDFIDGATGIVGLTAEDAVRHGLTHLVNYVDGQPESFRYGSLFSDLVGAVKHLTARLEALEAA